MVSIIHTGIPSRDWRGGIPYSTVCIILVLPVAVLYKRGQFLELFLLSAPLAAAL